MTLRAACVRLFVGLVVTAVSWDATALPRPWGTLAAMVCVVAALYSAAAIWRCDHLSRKLHRR